MLDAHVESVIIVGEPFATKGLFDFGNSNLTNKIYKYFPVMISNRLIPPPKEVYSLHRKLSGIYSIECNSLFKLGAYLINMKLKSKINCRKILKDIHEKVHKELDTPGFNY